jgi:hypothetical protein
MSKMGRNTLTLVGDIISEILRICTKTPRDLGLTYDNEYSVTTLPPQAGLSSEVESSCLNYATTYDTGEQ